MKTRTRGSRRSVRASGQYVAAAGVPQTGLRAGTSLLLKAQHSEINPSGVRNRREHQHELIHPQWRFFKKKTARFKIEESGGRYSSAPTEEE